MDSPTFSRGRVLRPDTPSASTPYAFQSLFGPVVGETDASADATDAAFEAGRQAGRAELEDEVARLRAERDELAAATRSAETSGAAAEEIAARLQALWAEGVNDLEPKVAALAIEVAEAVLDAPLSDVQRAAAMQALREALDAIAAAVPLTVRLHPIDLLHLQESGLAESVRTTHPQLRWEPDGTLAEGDWTVSSAQAAVRRLRAPILASLRERLGTPTLDAP